MNNYWMLGAADGGVRARPCAEGATAFDRLALGMRTGSPESVTSDPGSSTHAGAPDLEPTARPPGDSDG